MTAYNDKELADGWEFKILRSASGVFERPERMREILEEESRAGWILVEKFDSNRLRLNARPEVGKTIETWILMLGEHRSALRRPDTRRKSP